VALKAAVRAAAELLNSRITRLATNITAAWVPRRIRSNLLNPKAAQAFKRMLEGEQAVWAPAAAAPVKPGNYVWKNGALVPE
jgi:hypothetical protein